MRVASAMTEPVEAAIEQYDGGLLEVSTALPSVQPPAAKRDAQNACMRTRVYQDKTAFACTQKIQAFAEAWSHSLPGTDSSTVASGREWSSLLLKAPWKIVSDHFLSATCVAERDGSRFSAPWTEKTALDFAWAAFLLSVSS